MRSAARRLAALFAGTAGAVAALVVGTAGPAAAAPCPGTSGVTVVVGTSLGCAAGDPASVLAALHASGHTTVMVQRFPAAVCRIDAVPASDACVVMPPASAYWSLWTASRGGSWAFASTGVASLDPAPGSVVGLAFGAGSPPGVAPPAAPVPARSAPAPAQSTRPPSTSAPAPARRSGSATRATGSPVHPVARPPTSGAVTPRAARTAPGTSPAAPTSLGAVAASSRTTAAPGSGALSLATGGGLVLLLGGTTAYVVARRRRG